MSECTGLADVSWLTVSIVRGEEQVCDEGGENRPQH